jgi:hypothetical protein
MNETKQSFFDKSGMEPNRWKPASDGTKLLHEIVKPFSTAFPKWG